MLQIKNTLGGGKPEGMYAWKKYEIGSELKVLNESVSTLPYNFSYGSAVIYNNEIHILGSNYSSSTTTIHYKWNGSSWTSVSTLPFSFVDGQAVVYNNEIHILGGSSAGRNHYKWNGSSWAEVSTLPYDFSRGSAVIYNNEIHILGGNTYTKNHYKWNGSSWTKVGTLPYEFNSGSAVVFDNAIHILGGVDNSTKHYKFDGTSWTSVSILPYNYSSGSAVVFDNEIHILGSSDTAYKKYHYKWDGSTWTSVSTLPYSLSYGSAVVYNNGIHILGSNESSNYKKHYLIYGYAPVYTFLDYIVSDKETAYPDGGEKGGYWYEKVGDGLTPEMFGCTKFAIDEFVVASRTSTSSFASNISHSLGEAPKVAIISLIDNLSSLTDKDVFFLMRFQDAFEGSNSYHLEGYNDGTTNAVTQMSSGYGTHIDTMTDSNVPLNCPSSTYYWQYFAVGTYKVITMA